ncbi:hypothetical protein Q5W10_02935 [Waltera intestinalis]
MRKITSENSASLVLRGIAVILMIIPVFYTAAHVSSILQYKRTLIYIVLAVLAEVLTVVFAQKSWNDYIHVAGSALMAFAFASFANGGVLSVADYVAGINLFGDASQVPAIMTYGVMLLCGVILSIIDCFICKEVPVSAGIK